MIKCNPCLDVRLLLSRTKNRRLLKETNLPCEVTNYTFMIVRRAKKTGVCIKHDRHILSWVLLCCVSLPLAPFPSHTPFLLSIFFLFSFFYVWHLLGACPSCDTILLQLFRPPALSCARGALSIRPFWCVIKQNQATGGMERECSRISINLFWTKLQLCGGIDISLKCQVDG